MAALAATVLFTVAKAVGIGLVAGGAGALVGQAAQDLAKWAGKNGGEEVEKTIYDMINGAQTSEKIMGIDPYKTMWDNKMNNEEKKKFLEDLQKAIEEAPENSPRRYNAEQYYNKVLGWENQPLTQEEILKGIQQNPFYQRAQEHKEFAENIYNDAINKEGLWAENASITQPNNPQENEEEEKQPIVIPPSGENNSMIQDSTNNNIETNIGGLSAVDEWKKWAEEQRNALWAREDQIRKETQEREDNAWQRAVADMRKAGVNPNLVNAGPAASGGGITSATQMDMSTITNQMDIDAEKIQQLIDHAFEGKENEKQQFMDIFGDLLQTIVFSMVMRK